jgi:hypothetical protein
VFGHVGLPSNPGLVDRRRVSPEESRESHGRRRSWWGASVATTSVWSRLPLGPTTARVQLDRCASSLSPSPKFLTV